MKPDMDDEVEEFPHTWRLLGCDNGLRFFQEIPNDASSGHCGNKLSVVKCVGVVDAPPDRVCSLVLDYGLTRQLWDPTIESAHALEAKDGKTDVLQLTLRRTTKSCCWSPAKRLLLLRWWSKHPDGSYVIFFKSMPAIASANQLPSWFRSVSWLDCGAYIIRSSTPPTAHHDTTSPLPAGSCTASSNSNSNSNSSRSSTATTSTSPTGSIVELVLETQMKSCFETRMKSCFGCSCSGSSCGSSSGCCGSSSSCCFGFNSLQLDSLPLNLRPSSGGCPLLSCGSSADDLALRNAMFHSIAGLREFCKEVHSSEASTSSSHIPWANHRIPAALGPPPAHHSMHRGGAVGAGVGVMTSLAPPPPPPPLLPFTSSATGEGAGGVGGAGSRGEDGDTLKQPLLLRSNDSEGGDESFEDCNNESLSDNTTETALDLGTGALLHSLQQHTTADINSSAAQSAFPHIDWTVFSGSVRRGPIGQPDLRNCWTTPDGTSFAVRGESFYEDGTKVSAGEPQCELVAVDWLHSNQPISEVARRKGCVVQRVREHYAGRAPFFVVVNLQVPAGASSHYTMVFYFAVDPKSPCMQPGALLHKFTTIDDDSFRKERLTLIPAIPQGSWLVQKAVGSARFVMMAQVLDTKFIRGDGFLEVDVNMGTSSVVQGIVGLAIPCMSMLTVDMAFLVKSERDDPLPEKLFGAVRCCKLELSSAIAPPKA